MKHGKRVIMLIMVLINVCLLTGCGLYGNHAVRIVIPAGSRSEFVYSEEEVSPKKSNIILMAGEGLGDTMVVLESAGDRPAPTYLTPGMPVKTEAERGEWYRIGVSVQNPGEKDIVVYVDVKGAEWRIP